MFWKRKNKTTEKKRLSSILVNNDPNFLLFQRVMNQIDDGRSFYGTKGSSFPIFQEILDLPIKERAAFLTAYPSFADPVKPRKHYGDPKWQLKSFVRQFYSDLMRRKNDFTPEQLLSIISTIKSREIEHLFNDWPIGWIINQLGKSVKTNDLSDEMRAEWLSVSKWKVFNGKSYYGSDLNKARQNLLEILGENEQRAVDYPIGQTKLAGQIKLDLKAMCEQRRQDWNKIFFAASKASGGKPTKKFLTQMNELIDEFGAVDYKKQILLWIEKSLPTDSFDYGMERWDRGTPDGQISNLLKGLAWSMVRFHDEKSISAVSQLALRSMKKLPNIGSPAQAVGNACIYTLANSKGLGGVAHLSRLKLRIQQNSTQKLIQKYLDVQAEARGIKANEIEDMAAPDLGLTLGVKDFSFDEYTLRLDATDVGQARLSWIKPDGTKQKSVPSFVKEKAALKKKLDDIRKQAKDIKKTSTAQRDRIDRLYTEDANWSVENFDKYYLNHGLMSTLARRLIWSLTIKGKQVPALYHDEIWSDVDGKAVLGDVETIHLWHPIMSDVKDIVAWRERLEELQIKQPFKQAYREVYLLTEAEINTRNYSNRMAAHILKQHQFRSLAMIRGWKYTLMGAFDNGIDGDRAMKPLPAHNLTAEYWIDELAGEDGFNDTGIWDFVATDQVRFSNEENEAIDLIDIPPLILSEVLRDTDLFVGVASVGNDPLWIDNGGEGRNRNYWQSYSFGDLSETAKTRKLILERLLPKLKIRDKARIDGKFLIVQGQRHSYKIHIGSGNILIQPSDRYLCIVPGRGTTKSTDGLYLPFEGDRGLSIVLSKAFMLVDDHKITDKTILSQL